MRAAGQLRMPPRIIGFIGCNRYSSEVTTPKFLPAPRRPRVTPQGAEPGLVTEAEQVRALLTAFGRLQEKSN